ncbi:MAG: hypothetical protein HC911_08070 [Chloroflexaceae bacterium]|nr:hypothetical protein [Chloroflexaceae bacterium]
MPDIAEETASSVPPKRIRRQVIGRRLGLHPYYQIAPPAADTLILTAQTGDNRRVGRRYMLGGAALALVTPAVIIAFFSTGGQSFEAACFGSALSWPCATIGLLGVVSGRAVATTTNTITFDPHARTIRYTQQNQVHRLRSQTLQYGQVAQLRLKPRPVQVGNLLKRTYTLTVLEMVTDEEYVWIVDSARDPAELAPLAAAVAQILDMSLQPPETATA